MKKRFFAMTALAAVACLTFASCSGFPYVDRQQPMFSQSADESNYVYDSIVEQAFCNTSEQNASYFSLDRNTACYSMVRAQLNMGVKIAPDSVRMEELINYFSYDYPVPEEEIGAYAYLTDCPWNGEHKLITLGVRTEERVLTAERNNYVFLIDVSGSMSARVEGLEGMTCLDLVKTGIGKLVEGLTEHDAVSIVTYASGVEEKLEPTLASEQGKTEIMRAVNALNAYGSTYGSGGLQLAYETAEKYKTEDGNNRVILMTDGDFNVGLQDEETLKEFIQDKARGGVYLSVIGVGMYNMRDDFMQTLALSGNGNYAYIDSPREAEKVLKEELGGTLVTVAKDAKAGITFNQDTVNKYRLLGYDMKRMSESDFNNTEKDAGEIGSNLCVTAVYEVELAESAEAGDALAEVEVKYKSVKTGEENKSVRVQVANESDESNDLTFIACVAEFGLVLRQSQYRANANLSAVLSRLDRMQDYLTGDLYKHEFKELVEIAKNSGNYGN